MQIVKRTLVITIGQRKGNVKIVFIAENSEGEIYKTFVMVKIRKK